MILPSKNVYFTEKTKRFMPRWCQKIYIYFVLNLVSSFCGLFGKWKRPRFSCKKYHRRRRRRYVVVSRVFGIVIKHEGCLFARKRATLKAARRRGGGEGQASFVGGLKRTGDWGLKRTSTGDWGLNWGRCRAEDSKTTRARRLLFINEHCFFACVNKHSANEFHIIALDDCCN